MALKPSQNLLSFLVKIQAEGKISMKRVVQQTLVETTKPRLLETEIEEYILSHPPLNDDEEDKQGSNIGGNNQNPRSNSKPTCERAGKLRGNSKRSREVSTNTPNQPPPARRPLTDSNGSRRGSRNSSRNESRRNSSSRHNSNRSRSRERRGRSPPREELCRRNTGRSYSGYVSLLILKTSDMIEKSG